jgi:hypothetical protein
MAKDVFEKELAKGDKIIIDAVVDEVFDPDEDADHVRIRFTNGKGQVLVIESAAAAKVFEDETEIVSEQIGAELSPDAPADALAVETPQHKRHKRK